MNLEEYYWNLLDTGILNQNVWRERPSIGFGMK